MEQVVSFLVEDTQARMLALERFLHWFVLASLSISILAKMAAREGKEDAEVVRVSREGKVIMSSDW